MSVGFLSAWHQQMARQNCQPAIHRIALARTSLTRNLPQLFASNTNNVIDAGPYAVNLNMVSAKDPTYATYVTPQPRIEVPNFLANTDIHICIMIPYRCHGVFLLPPTGENGNQGTKLAVLTPHQEWAATRVMHHEALQGSNLEFPKSNRTGLADGSTRNPSNHPCLKEFSFRARTTCVLRGDGA